MRHLHVLEAFRSVYTGRQYVCVLEAFRSVYTGRQYVRDMSWICHHVI